jgi:hemerythrin-like domain-containing protein
MSAPEQSENMSREPIPEGPFADTRKMLEVHAMFRQQFLSVPALIAGVAPNDRDRTNVVADHIKFMCAFLHEHHSLEDEYLWPRLKNRGAEDVAEIALLMEDHHSDMARILDRLDDELRVWRDSTGSQHRSALAQTMEQLLPVLIDHMSLEESRALPVIEKHISAAEWERLAEAGREHFSPDDLMLALGMIVCAKLESAPDTPLIPFEQQGLQVYMSYAERVHGPDIHVEIKRSLSQ